ncbi:MAG: hypothetical protein M1827_002963 [Pycnora praestabilis]|nr:MAG: hypothetical protein M1827_002963 [Pycnora praestabilis]
MGESVGSKRRLSSAGSVSPPPVKRNYQSTTTKSAVASFFTPISKKDPEKTTWRVVRDSLLVARYEKAETHSADEPVPKKRKVAAFDFDSTLIQSASGNRFGKDGSDWKWWTPVVPGTLKELDAKGYDYILKQFMPVFAEHPASRNSYQIIILSNQGGISLKSDPKSVKSDQKRLADFKSKVGSVLSQLDLPISVYAATARDTYRKPRTGMWKEMLDDYDLDVGEAIDLNASLFVGDAGGRAGVNGSGKDHSCSDRDFAVNVAIAFHTPEEFFLHQSPKAFIRDFDPSTYISIAAEAPIQSNPFLFSKLNTIELVIFCGSPGAGKSTFYWKVLKPLRYERVNQDILKTRERCIKRATEYVSEGKSVAIDNTNADSDTRAVWVQLARKLAIPIRCIYFTAPSRLCEHNDTVRALNGPQWLQMNPEGRTILPKVAFTGFTARFRAPNPDEGFQEIVKVDFKGTTSNAQPGADIGSKDYIQANTLEQDVV